MKSFIQYIIENNSTSAVEQVTKALKSKTATAIEEARKQVAAEVFTDIEESLSKKHFVTLANHIKNSGVPFSKEHLNVISDFLGKNGPNFDRDRWHGYMAGANGPSGGRVKKVKEEVELGEESQSMSKKHFISLANHIRQSPVPFKKDHLNVLADYLQSQNPNFKRDRWHGYIAGENGSSGGRVAKKKVAEAVQVTEDKHLSAMLKQHHGKNPNGVWLTDYSKIPGLKVHASTTNGTSGLGKYKGKKVYWNLHHPTGEFQIESVVNEETITEDKVPHPWTKELTSRGFKQSKRAVGDPHWDFHHENGNHVLLGSLPAAPGKKHPQSYFYMHVKGKEKPVAQGSHKDSLRDALTTHHK